MDTVNESGPMNKNRVIEFDSKRRILERAKKYVESVELFLDEGDQAVSLMLRALKHADGELKREIMFVLGTFAKEKVIWPLFEMMIDASENDEFRNDAAIQLSVIGPLLTDPQLLIDRLLEEIQSPDIERRLHATFAIGWRGNDRAALPLIERLYDDDGRVQESAVNALCNLRDDKILHLLVDRLEHGPMQQKRIILFNLWRFSSKKEEVTEIYRKYLDHESSELRFDALVCLGRVTDVRQYVKIYRKCLRDKDERVRELALKRLADEGGESILQSFRAEIQTLLDAPEVKVKKAALQALKKLTPAS
jgi:HEAT repeat protein